MVEFIKNLKEKQKIKRKLEITQQAEDTICLSDFNNQVYIAYNGTPLVVVEDSWKSQEIIQELHKLRDNFISARLKEYKIES
jgi:hypothetical protein